jgi:glycosyltransferase involved in cell wall biosynthesis
VYSDAPTFGGAEQVLATVLDGLGDRYRITVVGTCDEVVDRLVAGRERASAMVLPTVRTKGDLPAIVAHVKAIRRLGPAIVHVNLRTPYAAQYGLLGALATRRAKVIAVEHLPLHSDSRVSRWFKRRTSARLSAHVAVAERTARFVEADAGLPPGSVRTIWNGVPRPAGDGAERLAPSPVVGAIGRLDPQKGFDVLVRALALVPGLHGVVVGSGPADTELRALADATGVSDRFLLAGHRESARSALAAFDVLVAPSRFEGLPLVVLEAMAAKVPIVATTVGGIPEALTDGETALLVPPDDPPALAAAMRRLIEDDGLRALLAARAHEVWAQRFDATTMVRAYEQLYADLTA